MGFFRSSWMSLALLLLVASCTPYLYQHPLGTQPARLGAELAGNAAWQELPAPQRKTVVAVYKFRDQTGQYKPQASGASFSTAVTQGATTILIRALEESQWFEPIERENLGNLLNERKIIRSTRQEFTEQTGQKQPTLPPLLFAGVILEGGIISYDANMLTGGAGLRYFGAGASGQYRQDRVTVYLRAISTSTGKVLKTVYTSKTILSQQVDASLFRFVDFKRLLETETGFTYNEPSEIAVKDAIEKSVQALIYEGFADKLWVPRDTAEVHGPGLRSYQREKAENLTIDVLGRQVQPRRPVLSIGLAGTAHEYVGDFGTGSWRMGTELAVQVQPSAPLSVFLHVGRTRLAAGPNSSYFNQAFGYAEAGLLFRLLPYNRFTPTLSAGGGIMMRQPMRLAEPYPTIPHILGGLGGEYLITPHIGLNLGVENRYFLNDQLDLANYGRYNDFAWGVRAGVNVYLGKSNR